MSGWRAASRRTPSTRRLRLGAARLPASTATCAPRGTRRASSSMIISPALHVVDAAVGEPPRIGRVAVERHHRHAVRDRVVDRRRRRARVRARQQHRVHPLLHRLGDALRLHRAVLLRRRQPFDLDRAARATRTARGPGSRRRCARRRTTGCSRSSRSSRCAAGARPPRRRRGAGAGRGAGNVALAAAARRRSRKKPPRRRTAPFSFETAGLECSQYPRTAQRPPQIAADVRRVTVERTPLATTPVDRNLALEVVRVTEAAALAAARFVGLGYKDGADRAATEAMRRTFGYLHIRGRVVIGEGERDEAPMLYIGEEVGDGDAGRARDRHRRRSAGGDEPVRQRPRTTRWPSSRWPSTASS